MVKKDCQKNQEQKLTSSQLLNQKSSFYSKKNPMQDPSNLEKIDELNHSIDSQIKPTQQFSDKKNEKLDILLLESKKDSNSSSDQSDSGSEEKDVKKKLLREDQQVNNQQEGINVQDSQKIETKNPSQNEIKNSKMNTYNKLMGDEDSEDEGQKLEDLNILQGSKQPNQENPQKITRAMSEYYDTQGNEVTKKQSEQNQYLESIVDLIDNENLQSDIDIQQQENNDNVTPQLNEQPISIKSELVVQIEREQENLMIQTNQSNQVLSDQNIQNKGSNDDKEIKNNEKKEEKKLSQNQIQTTKNDVVNQINQEYTIKLNNQDQKQIDIIQQDQIQNNNINLENNHIQDEFKQLPEKLNLESQHSKDVEENEDDDRSQLNSVNSSFMESPKGYMVQEEDFNSPIPQKQNQIKLVPQSNFLIQFIEQKKISQQIIDIPNVRNQDVKEKDYMIRMEQEFNLNQEIQKPKEKIGSQKQLDIKKLNFIGMEEQGKQEINLESRGRNQENKNQSAENENQFGNFVEKTDSIIQLYKENNKRPGLGLPIIKSKFDNLRYDNDLMWFGINSYKAIFHSSQILGSKEIQNTLISLESEKDIWKNIFFLSHSEILKDENNYLDMMKEKLGDFNLTLLMKFFRPDILEDLTNVHLTKQLSKYFVSHTKTNLNAHSRANWYNKPTVIFYGHLNKTINELLELKACKQNPNIKVKRIPLGSISNKVIKQELKNASVKGDWVVLENIKSVPYDQLSQLIKIINNALNSNENKNEYFKVWITQQQMNKSYELQENPGIVQTHRNNSQTLLQQFFFNCFKMFINRPNNIKNNLSVLYTLEIHEYLAFVEKKVTQTLPSNYNFSTLGKQLQSPIHETIKYRFQKQKRHENINYSYNIHSVFIDRVALREKNKHSVNILEKFSNKIKFNIFFIFSILRQRQKYHRKLAEYYQQSELLFFSDLDLLYIVEDGFHFLNYYSINPSLFFRTYLKLIFSEEMPYNAHSTWNIASMRDLLEELVFKGIDKQTIYTSGDQKYTLFIDQPNQTTEETIFKTINELPNLDSPQIIEISPNTEIQYGFNRSQRLMARIHKKVYLQEQLGKEAEMLKELKTQIEQSTDEKDSLSDVSIVSSNDKNIQKGDDFILQQIGQIYAYWINHIDLLGKNMTIIQKIQQIQSEFKILFEKSQNLDLFQSKFGNSKIQEESNSDSDSSSDMSEDQNAQNIILNKYSKNAFQIKLKKNNNDSDSSFDSSFSDSRNEQESQQSKNKLNQSPQKQSFVAEDQNLKKDLQKWLSTKPLHDAPIISRKSNLQNIREKSETQFSNNRLSSPRIKSSVRQPSITNVMVGNLQSSPLLNIKPNYRLSVANISQPHRQSVFFGKQFIVENQNSPSPNLNSPSHNLNSPSKNSLIQLQQSPIGNNSPTFHPRKESIFLKQSNIIGQNLIKASYSDQTPSNKVSDSIQLLNSQTTCNTKETNQPVYNSTLQNELQIAKSLLKRIITDLDGSSFTQQQRILLQADLLKTSEQESILIDILENKVPQNWWIQSFLIRENDLQQYMKYLVLKLETLKLILEERRCKMYPVIQLDQMFDPFFLISSFLTYKSTELNTSIFDLKIECEIQDKPQIQQPTDGSMLINGFFIKNGRLNDQNVLEVENPREFEYKIPNMKIIVKKKIYKNSFYKNYASHVTMNFTDQSLYDFEGTYYAQNQFINGTKKIQKSEFIGKKASADSKQYIVRLPVVNSLTNHLFNSFPMRIYFYFKSSKPQEFWVKRSTEIYLQQEFL